jgi:hypothetical protein
MKYSQKTDPGKQMPARKEELNLNQRRSPEFGRPRWKCKRRKHFIANQPFVNQIASRFSKTSELPALLAVTKRALGAGAF